MLREPVDGADRPIGIGGVIVGFQYLKLIVTRQNDAAVAAHLSLATRIAAYGKHPLDVELNMAESGLVARLPARGTISM